jgi:hypothetical protein
VAEQFKGQSVGRDHTRRHLTLIAEAFANGDFDIPMFVHDPQVVIRTPNPQALAAIHKFLR